MKFFINLTQRLVLANPQLETFTQTGFPFTQIMIFVYPLLTARVSPGAPKPQVENRWPNLALPRHLSTVKLVPVEFQLKLRQTRKRLQSLKKHLQGFGRDFAEKHLE